MSGTPPSQALRALSRFLIADVPLGETLQQMADITVDALPGADFAGIALLDEREQPTTGVYTDPRAPKIDQAQYETGRGPCLDAWRRKECVRLDHLDTDPDADYSEFALACRNEGVQSTLSMPLVAGGDGIGALNLYSPQENGFSELDEEIGGDLATSVSVVLANSSAYWGAYELSQQLNEAMKSRAVIEQAKGILMANSPDMSADDAFDMLRKASQRENVKLREIAQRIVERRPDAGSSR